MKRNYLILNWTLLLLTVVFISSCKGQSQTPLSGNSTKQTRPTPNKPLTAAEKEDMNFDRGIYSGFLDSKGILWFSSNLAGVYKYTATDFDSAQPPPLRAGDPSAAQADQVPFTHFTEEDGLCSNEVTSIVEDKDGTLWFGTAAGLCRYDGERFTTIALPQSDTSGLFLDKVYPVMNPNKVMSLLIDKRGGFWIGTGAIGAYYYSNGMFTNYLSEVGKVYEGGLQHNAVLSITEDLSGDIWFTSLSHGGTSRYSDGEFTQYLTEDGLSDNFVRTSYCDRSGTVWIGSHGNRNGGLDRYNSKTNTFTTFLKTNDGLTQNHIWSIFEDKSGDLWIGSGRDNLTIFDGEHFKEFVSKDGRKFPNVHCVLEDADGNIWFGGQHGLWKYDGEDLVDMTKIGKK